MPKKIISVVLEVDTIKELEKFCKELNSSKAELMRFAIQFALRNEEFRRIIRTLF